MAAIAAPVNLVDNNAVMTHIWGVLGLTANQINALTTEGTDSLRSFSVLKTSDITVSRTTVQHVTSLDLKQPDVKSRAVKFDKEIRELLDKELHIAPGEHDFTQDDLHLEGNNGENVVPGVKAETQDEGNLITINQPHSSEADQLQEHTPDTFDDCVGAQILIPRGDGCLDRLVLV